MYIYVHRNIVIEVGGGKGASRVHRNTRGRRKRGGSGRINSSRIYITGERMVVLLVLIVTIWGVSVFWVHRGF